MPGLRVDLTTVRSPVEELALLRSGAADAAFLWLPIGDVGLPQAEVRTDRRCVAVPLRHRLAERDTVTLADLADEPVLRPSVYCSDESERQWMIDPRPDGRPAVPGPVVREVEDCLLAVARGRGVWFAPEPLSRWPLAAAVRWLPVTDAPPLHLGVVWAEHAAARPIAQLVAELRAITGWQPEDADVFAV